MRYVSGVLPESFCTSSEHCHAPPREFATVASLGGRVAERMQEPRGLVFPEKAAVLAQMSRANPFKQAARSSCHAARKLTRVSYQKEFTPPSLGDR